MQITAYIEILPARRSWRDNDVIAVKQGRTWKRRPSDDQITPGAIVAEATIEVPADRMRSVVRATIPSAQPLAIRSA